jgi:hypothetical protein
MSTDIAEAIERLHSQLPLLGRQRALPPTLAQMHRAILRSLAERGRVPSRDELAAAFQGNDVDGALQRLGNDDLVVLNESRTEAVGAYPMTVEATPHRLNVNGTPINAMCALDALSVGPMFDAEVEIDSRCQVSGEPIHIHQRGREVLAVTPSAEVRVGVRWQQPSACAAHSMCLEMVFLEDEPTALTWQDGDTENISLFTLGEAIAFGAGFFNPLVKAA